MKAMLVWDTNVSGWEEEFAACKDGPYMLTVLQQLEDKILYDEDFCEVPGLKELFYELLEMNGVDLDAEYEESEQ